MYLLADSCEVKHVVKQLVTNIYSRTGLEAKKSLYFDNHQDSESCGINPNDTNKQVKKVFVVAPNRYCYVM